MNQNSIKDFDDILKEELHFKIHEEMLPYIGPKYLENKILLISESHFVPINTRIPNDEEWYNPKDLNILLNEIEYNSFTREIIEKFFDGKNKPHRLFLNLDSALKKSNLSLGLEYVAWYNYFQKPAFNKDSINATETDYKIAEKVFEKIIKTIEPNIIIITSVKSFENIFSNLKWDETQRVYFYKSFKSKIEFVCHPNSIWWYRKSKKYYDKIKNENRSGLQKFIDTINYNIK